MAALRTATDHLVPGGTFCTKVYRSTDYNSIIWVLQQLFEDVQTMKPNSSRSQSSETFLVCLGYTSPDKIDHKLFDINHVFKEVEENGSAKMNILHKKFEQHNKRHRTGYDESLGVTLRASVPVSDFITSNEPIKLLTYASELVFTDDEMCAAIREHPKTTKELVDCFKDLKVLGKTDFKKLLRWRQQLRNSLELDAAPPLSGAAGDGGTAAEAKDRSEMTEEEIQEEIMNQRVRLALEQRRAKKKERELKGKERRRRELGMSSEAFGVEDEIDLFHLDKNTTEEDMIALGNVNLDELDEFPLVTNQFGEYNDDLDDSEPVDLPRGKRRRSAIIELAENSMEEELELDYRRFLSGRRARIAAEQDLEAAAKHAKRKKGDVSDDLNETLSAKRHRLAQEPDAVLAGLSAADDELLQHAGDEDEMEEAIVASATSLNKRKKRKDALGALHGDSELDAYVKLLEGKAHKKRESADAEADDRESDSESSSSSSDASDEEPNNKHGKTVTFDDDDDDVGEDADEDQSADEKAPAAPEKRKRGATDSAANDKLKRKMVSFSDESSSVKAAQWFSNPIFNTTLLSGGGDDAAAASAKASSSRSKKAAAAAAAGEVDAYESMASMMPLTDKQMRKEKRKKEAERRERKELKQQRMLQEEDEEDDLMRGSGALIKQGVGKTASAADAGFEVVPADADEDDRKASITVAKALQRRSGAGAIDDSSDEGDDNDDDAAAAAEAATTLPPRADDRIYDSDHEEYDAHDRTRTLALATMMLRHSKKKALVDASYNRFAWNDPNGLPSWFVDDELRHNKPQVPIPGALIDQIKSRFQKTGTKEIKKVAEARMRKRKRAAQKLQAAKKAANSMAENNEMSEKQKLRVRPLNHTTHRTEHHKHRTPNHIAHSNTLHTHRYTICLFFFFNNSLQLFTYCT